MNSSVLSQRVNNILFDMVTSWRPSYLTTWVMDMEKMRGKCMSVGYTK